MNTGLVEVPMGIALYVTDEKSARPERCLEIFTAVKVTTRQLIIIFFTHSSFCGIIYLSEIWHIKL